MPGACHPPGGFDLRVNSSTLPNFERVKKGRAKTAQFESNRPFPLPPTGTLLLSARAFFQLL